MSGQHPNGDFALYLFHHIEEAISNDTPVFRYWNADDARAEAHRLIKGGVYRYIWMGRWNYETDDDEDFDEFEAT